jgi:Protein of unknown function (DUF1264)
LGNLEFVMNRRELFAALGTASIFGDVAAAGDHGAAMDKAGPLAGGHLHFCGIHMAKNNPKVQFLTQHYCAAHTGGSEGDIFQCVLFDGVGKNARLLGVEYLISDEAYRKLPDDEKKYWHAHTYEVLGGCLIAPGMNADDEMKFMKTIMTTWGKAWHTWPDPKTAVPTGEPLLIWSLMADGQADPKIVAERDKQFACDTRKISEKRGADIGFEVPKVAAPTSLDTIGRQWTQSGDDRPTKKN